MVIDEVKNFPKGFLLLQQKSKQYDKFLKETIGREGKIQERKKALLEHLKVEMTELYEKKDLFLTAINAHSTKTCHEGSWNEYRLGGQISHSARSYAEAIRAYPYAEGVLKQLEAAFEELSDLFSTEFHVLKNELIKIDQKERLEKETIKSIEKQFDDAWHDQNGEKVEEFYDLKLAIKDFKKEIILEEEEVNIARRCYELAEKINKLLGKDYAKSTKWKSGIIFRREWEVTIFNPDFFNTWNNEILPMIKEEEELIEQLMKKEHLNLRLDTDATDHSKTSGYRYYSNFQNWHKHIPKA